MKESNNREQYFSSTLQKGLDVLSLLGEKSLTLTEICRELGINKTTALRLVYTLEHEGFVERSEETLRYRLGIKMVELCSIRINDIELKTEAKPFLMELVNKIHQPVHLGIYSNGNAVYIDKIDVSSTIRIYSAIGKTIPVYCSAIGKALLLDWSDDDVRGILDKYGMEAFTPYTIQSPDTLLAQLHEAKARGYTVDNCEHEESVFCLAAPIRDYRNKIIASISTAAHVNTVVDQESLINLLKTTAHNISNRLGYHD